MSGLFYKKKKKVRSNFLQGLLSGVCILLSELCNYRCKFEATVRKYYKRNKIFMFGILPMLKIKCCFIVIFLIVYTTVYDSLTSEYVDVLTGM